jgi:hypothetical protein
MDLDYLIDAVIGGFSQQQLAGLQVLELRWVVGLRDIFREGLTLCNRIRSAYSGFDQENDP